MSGVLQRRDSYLNLVDVLPSDRELVQIEDLQRYGLKLKGKLRIVSMMLHRDAGHEMRDYDPLNKKGVIGYKSIDMTFVDEDDPIGVGALGMFSQTFGKGTLAFGDNSHAFGQGVGNITMFDWFA